MPRNGAALLSEWLPKIAFACESCGIARRYDRDAMLARIGEQRMTDILDRIAVANGCPRQDVDVNSIFARCPARFTEVPAAPE